MLIVHQLRLRKTNRLPNQLLDACSQSQIPLKVADKSDESTAIPALLALLDLAGCTIMIDAMGTSFGDRGSDLAPIHSPETW